MARSPITTLVESYNALTEVEQKVFLDLVDPQPDPGPAAKQTRKKRGPSKKQQSLSNAIQGTLKAADTENAAGPKCTVCGNEEDYQDHYQPSPHYHPFGRPVPPAGKRSSRKGAATSSTANTEVETGNASAVGASGD